MDEDIPDLVEEEDYFKSLENKKEEPSVKIKQETIPTSSNFIPLTKEILKETSNPKEEDDVPPLLDEEEAFKMRENNVFNDLPPLIEDDSPDEKETQNNPKTSSSTKDYKDLPPLISSDDEAKGEIPKVEDDLPPLITSDDEDVQIKPKKQEEEDGPPPLLDSEDDEDEPPGLETDSEDDLIEEIESSISSIIKSKIKKLNGEFKPVTNSRSYQNKPIPKHIQSFIDSWNGDSPLFYSDRLEIDYFKIIKEFTSENQRHFPNHIFFGIGNKELSAEMSDSNEDFTVYLISKENRTFKVKKMKLSLFLSVIDIVEDDDDEEEEEEEEEEEVCNNPFCTVHHPRRNGRFEEEEEDDEDELEEDDSGCDDPFCTEHHGRRRNLNMSSSDEDNEEPIYPVGYSDTMTGFQRKRTTDRIREINHNIIFKHEPELKKRKIQDKNVMSFLLLCYYCKENLLDK